MPEAFLFDVGNVIVEFDFSLTARRIADQCTVPGDEIVARVAPLTNQLESGRISADTFISETIKNIGYNGDRPALVKAFGEIFTLNLPMVDFIESLHEKQFPLHLLSNTNSIHVPVFENTYPVFERFNGRIYSYEVGCMKPSPQIFEIAIEQLSLNPEATIYIDDLPENCNAGREAGLRTVCYRKEAHEEFLEEVSSLMQL